jgi:hypothetical protein
VDGTLGAVWGWRGAAEALRIDVGLYGLSAIFASMTATASTLAPHRAWGTVAAAGYAAAAAVAVGQFAARSASGRARRARTQWLWGTGGRATLAGVTWVATALVPLLWQAIDRAGGRADRAQEEVLVVEGAGRRLLESGTPYLDRSAIAALPADDRLTAYLPYQPGMALFGAPRALDSTAGWWSDARIWFAAATVAGLAIALLVLRRAAAPPPALVRALQVATVLPVCALTMATGGDDMPVLTLCLLGLALAATHRLGLAGLAVGMAAALKLVAWPVAAVLGMHALTKGRVVPYLAGAIGLPVLTAAPVILAGPSAAVENVLAFPSGRGLVTSPAASPLPGYLIASSGPAGRAVVIGLLLAVATGMAVALVLRPPRTASAVCFFCGYGLLAAILLLPAPRFGYLLYPAAVLVWASALRAPEREELAVPDAGENRQVPTPAGDLIC